MQLDVVSLWDFYYSRHLGAVAQRALQGSLRRLWPNCRGETVVGYGFAAPFLRPFRQEAARTLCLMPDHQGARAWPRSGEPNLTALTAEGLWPLPNGFVDRLIVAHAFETEIRLDAMMEEIWRVLAPEGRALIIAANRSGLWARSDGTPFGVGRPFSHGQLERMLASHKLTPLGRDAALFFPPSDRRFWLRSAGAAERMGRRLDAQRLAGAVIVEAGKRVYAPPGKGAREGVRDMLKPIKGLTAAKPAGASRG